MQSFMKSYDEKVLSFSSNLGYHVRCHFRKFNLKLSLFVEKGKRNHRMDQLKQYRWTNSVENYVQVQMDES